MKLKRRGWKEGIMKKDLRSLGAAMAGKPADHKKGDLVRYRRHKVFESERSIWTGEYEWHYLDLENYNLVRSNELLIEEEKS